LPQKEMLLSSKCLNGLIINSNNLFFMDSCHKRPTSLFENLNNGVRIKMVLQLFFKCLFFKKHLELGYYFTHPPNSLKDSNASPKVKTTNKKEIGACSLTHNTSRVKGAC
jgi:hypothetical protein